jgi:hypothetical protein
MNIFIEIVILFVLILFYFSVSNPNDSNNNWLRALVLGFAIPVLGLLPSYIGIIGWLIAFVVALMLISKSTGQDFGGSLLFLIIIGFVQYIVQLGIYKFI